MAQISHWPKQLDGIAEGSASFGRTTGLAFDRRYFHPRPHGSRRVVLQTRAAAAPPTKAGRKAAGPAKSPVRRSGRSPAPRVLLNPAG